METTTEKQTAKQTTAKKTAQKKFTDDTEVTVISNVKGRLIYRNNSNDYWEWGEYGDEHEFTVKDLKAMKAQQAAFFKENWIIFSEKDLEVIKHLKVDKYYTDVVFPEDIEAMFEKSESEFAQILDNATSNVKSLILARAREKYESGDFVNARMIRVLEERLHVDIDINNPR